MTKRRSDRVGMGSAPAGPTLTGSEDEALVQALRNLWPILGKPSRTKALGIVKAIQEE